MVNSQLKTKDLVKGKKSPWFWAFWVLFVMLILSALFVTFLASQNVEVIDQKSKIAQTDATFDVSLNKKQVNALVAHYLSDQHTDNYQFRVDQNVMMYGNMQALGQNFRFGVILIPEVTENGNVILTAKKMSVGNMSLPISTVMTYVKFHYHAPNFVTINPKKKQFFVNMSKLPVTKGMSFKAKKINLVTDQFIFEGGLSDDQK